MDRKRWIRKVLAGMSSSRTRLARFTFAWSLTLVGAMADDTRHDLATGVFSQDWSRTGMITAGDDWSCVGAITGHRGDGLSNTAGTDPRTITADGTGTPVDVNANRSDPGSFATGGIAEFDGIPDPTVALQGSGTARAPFLLLSLCSTGMMQVRVQYDLRDIDGSADNASQAVALQYRVGAAGAFVNVPAAFVDDATTGPGLATKVTHVDTVLPAEADDRSQLQVRVITSDAAGSDEWVGVDNIVVSASPLTAASVPKVKEDGGFSIGCATRAGWSYQLQRSTDLMAWQDVGSAFEGDGTVHHFEDSLPGDRGFWRVEVR